MIVSATDLDFVARTVMAEAEGEPYKGKVAVAAVIYNRARNPAWWGTNIKTVCLMPKQFSAWNDNNPRRSRIGTWDISNAVFRECMRAALDAVTNDPTNGADHYFAHDVVNPDWADDVPVQIIGNHSFVKRGS